MSRPFVPNWCPRSPSIPSPHRRVKVVGRWSSILLECSAELVAQCLESGGTCCKVVVMCGEPQGQTKQAGAVPQPRSRETSSDADGSKMPTKRSVWRLKLFLNKWRYCVAASQCSVLVTCSMRFESLEAFRHISKMSPHQTMCPKLYSISVSDGDSPIVSGLPGCFLECVVSAGSSQTPYCQAYSSWLRSAHFSWTVTEGGFLES